ncbi:MAG: phage portal protein [Dehalococcoidia bacterium]
MTDFKPSDLAQLDRSRFSDYKSNLDFYNGSQWAAKSKNRQLVFNYAKIAIDKITSYLMTGLNYAFEPLNNIAVANAAKQSPATTKSSDLSKRAEDLIYQVLDQNNCGELDYTTEVDAAILGDGCFKVTWDAVEKRIRITAPDVNGLYAWWTGDDLTRVYQVASRYQLSQAEILSLYKKATQKKTVQMTELWTAKDFILFMDTDVIDRKPNPYGFIPFIIFPNLRQPKQFWGVSDIPTLQEPQKELNRALSQLSRILEVSGNPIAVLEGVESSDDIQVRPGAVWNLPNDTKAYLLDLLQGGGIRLHIDYINLVYQTLHDLSESPRAAYGGIQKELSGVALEVELQSLLQKVNRKRLVRTNVYKRRNEMILKLWAKFMREDLTQTSQKVCWGQVLPQDRARESQNEQLLVQSGIHSRRTAMDNLSVRDPELEFEKWMDERKRILQQNNDFKAQSTQGGARERNVAADMQAPV